MQTLTSYAAPLGRLLIAALFLPAGLQKLADPAGTAGYVASGGLPGFFVWGAIAVEIIAPIFLVLGYHTRAAALVLAAFTLVAGLLYHLVPGLQGGEGAAMQMMLFYKNLGLTGGLLAFTAFGAGPLALDNRDTAQAQTA